MRLVRQSPLAVAATLLGALFVFPFLIASAPCERRLDAYAWTGLGVFVAVVLVPFVLPGRGLVASRWASALILAVLCVGGWVAGLVSADVRIICRLF